MRDEDKAHVGVYDAILLRRWVHIRDSGPEPSVSLDAAIKPCYRGQGDILDKRWCSLPAR